MKNKNIKSQTIKEKIINPSRIAIFTGDADLFSINTIAKYLKTPNITGKDVR